jgi:predicted deacylase
MAASNEMARKPGKEFMWLPVTTMASGMELRLPVHIVTGAKPGPTVGYTAGIHGDEYLPLESMRQLIEGLDPAQLAGTIIAVPVVNPLAVEAQTRHTPTDMQNLNRVFPGDPDGWVTEQIAAKVIEWLLPKIEVLIDLHAGGAQPIVDYVYILNDEALSRAFGFNALYRPSQDYPGTLAGIAVERDIRSVVVEMGGGMIANDEYLERGTRGLFNVLKHLGMIEGSPIVPDAQTVVTRMAVIRPHVGGLLHPGVKLADVGGTVPQGTVLGTVISPYTFEVLEEIRAPFAQNYMILLRPTITKVHPGDYAYMVAEQ